MQVKDSTGDDERKGVEVTSTHEEELPGSRGSANFALRWHKDSKMPAHLNVHEIEKEAKTKAKDILRGAYTADDEGKFIGIVGFDCRGMEVTDWQPQVPCASLCLLLLQGRAAERPAQHCQHGSGSSEMIAASLIVLTAMTDCALLLIPLQPCDNSPPVRLTGQESSPV